MLTKQLSCLFPLNRHVLGGAAPLLVVACVAAFELLDRTFPRVSPAQWERRFAFFAVLASAAITPGQVGLLEDFASSTVPRAQARAELGAWLSATVPAGEQVVAGAVGRIAYDLDVRVVDAYCLNDARVTGPPISQSAPKVVDLYLQDAPAAFVVGSESAESFEPHPYRGVFPELVSRPAFRSGYRMAYQAAVAPGFSYWVFLRNDL